MSNKKQNEGEKPKKTTSTSKKHALNGFMGMSNETAKEWGEGALTTGGFLMGVFGASLMKNFADSHFKTDENSTMLRKAAKPGALLVLGLGTAWAGAHFKLKPLKYLGYGVIAGGVKTGLSTFFHFDLSKGLSGLGDDTVAAISSENNSDIVKALEEHEASWKPTLPVLKGLLSTNPDSDEPVIKLSLSGSKDIFKSELNLEEANIIF